MRSDINVEGRTHVVTKHVPGKLVNVCGDDLAINHTSGELVRSRKFVLNKAAAMLITAEFNDVPGDLLVFAVRSLYRIE